MNKTNNNKMKPYLVDVPVRINIWIRPECQKKQWDVVRQARPSIIFLQSDGGRNEKEWEAIYHNRKMVDDSIDWECQVYRFYEDHNNGLYAMGKKVSQFIWSKVDRCIFTEDDQIMAISFFQYCAELLEKYKDDQRIECICGMNHLGVCENVTSDYFFSTQGSIWGNATWKRVIEQRSLDYSEDPYIYGLLKENSKVDKSTYQRIVGYAENYYFDGHAPASEFYIDLDMFAQHRLQIIPKYNLISNIGCTDDSEHSIDYKCLSKNTQSVFNTKTYEISFPLKHPKYVIPDIGYQKKRDYIMRKNHPVISIFEKIETRFRILHYKGFKAALTRKGKRIEK